MNLLVRAACAASIGSLSGNILPVIQDIRILPG